MALKIREESEETRADQVETVQRWLTELGFDPEGIDGRFGQKTQKAVIRFQESEGLYADGIVGPVTMEALEEAYMRHIIELNSPGIGAGEEGVEDRMQFVRCDANAYRDGYDRFWLRQDAADAYNKVRKIVVDEWGGELTSSGAKRSLDAKVSPNRSATSFHYLGLALDLHVWSGMEDPQKDPYVINVDNYEERKLEVFVRCSSEKVEPIKVNNVLKYGRSVPQKPLTVEGRFKSLTELFGKHGFKPIAARRRFFEEGAPLSAEWWHFQYEKPLSEYVSTFGRELLRIYSIERLKVTQPWRYRDHIFKIQWF